MAASCAVSCLRGDEARSVEGLVAMNMLEAREISQNGPDDGTFAFSDQFQGGSVGNSFSVTETLYVSLILGKNLDSTLALNNHSLCGVQNCI